LIIYLARSAHFPTGLYILCLQ